MTPTPDELHKDNVKVLRAAMDTLIDHIDYLEREYWVVWRQLEEANGKLQKLEDAGFDIDEALEE